MPIDGRRQRQREDEQRRRGRQAEQDAHAQPPIQRGRVAGGVFPHMEP